MAKSSIIKFPHTYVDSRGVLMTADITNGNLNIVEEKENSKQIRDRDPQGSEEEKDKG